MANREQILDKIKRNLEQLSITVDTDDINAETGERFLQAGNITIHYTDAIIQSPMGGVSDAAAPFLGIGTANPGKIVLAGLLDADSTIASIMADEDDLRITRVASGMANTIEVRAGATDLGVDGTLLATLEGHVDLLGMGQ